GVAGIQDASQQYLNRAGVPQTIGQILGGSAARTEDRLAGLPIIGDQINMRRREGIEAFNRAAFDEALAPIQGTTGGQIGEAGVGAAHDATSAAYRQALGGTRVIPDAPFEQGLTEAVGAVRSIPRVGEEVADSLASIVN